MLIIDLVYKKELSEIEKHLQAHRAFLKIGYERKQFLASGPKNPRNGGVIIALTTKAEAEQLIQQDPFYKNDLAEYNITEFNPVLHAACLDPILAGE